MADLITRWEPLAPALTLRDAMDRLFEDSVVWPRPLVNREVASRLNSLPMDMYETADEVVVNMIVPGVKSDDINLQFQDGRLIIDVTIPAPKLENVIWHCRELGHGQYHREISLPFDINTNKVEAALANGYLSLHLPKADEIKPKRIQVKAR